GRTPQPAAAGAGPGGRGDRACPLAPVQPVPDAADRRDEPRVRRVVLDLAAEALHRDVDQSRVAEVVVVPHALEEHLPSEDLPRAARQLEEQPELGGREREVAPTLAGDEAGRIDLDVAERHAGLLGLRAGPPE